LERSKQNKQRALLTYDNQLAVLYDAQDTTAKQIKIAMLSSKPDQVDKHIRTLAKISESIVNITATQLNLANAITADTIIELDNKEEILSSGLNLHDPKLMESNVHFLQRLFGFQFTLTHTILS